MKLKCPPAFLLTFSLVMACSWADHLSAQDLNSLRAGFKDPPSGAWPRTWWHWTRSNISKEGITKDLEWMKRSGIAGFQIADVNAGGGQVVKDSIVFGTPEWLDAINHTAKEADRLGLEMAIFSSPGWSLTGGSWVKPEQAMKKLVWSELKVEGNKRFSAKLPMPPANEGPGPNLQSDKGSTGFYRDFAVIAFRTPVDEQLQPIPEVTSNNGKENAGILRDNDVTTALTVRPASNGKAWLQLNYVQALPARAITIAARRGIPFGTVSASEDGINFNTLTAIPGISGYRGGNIRTYSFPETRARFFRIEFTNAAPRPADVISENTTLPDTAYVISEIQVHSASRIHRWEDKAGFNFLFDYSTVATPSAPSSSLIDNSTIQDLSNKMNADGTLEWDMPGGNWTIMRFGFALTGAKNRPAIPAALGYEVDKMNPEHVTSYMRSYTGPIKKALGTLYGTRLSHVLLDSWEAGIQNWTDIMPAEFKKRRGYDITSFLPALTGKVIGDAETSDRFLWDFRRTLVDLIAEYHYGTITDYLHKEGLKTYGEAGGVSLESIEDALLNKKYVDIPMGEFWVRDLHPSTMYFQDVRGAASASHIYGKKLVAAEAFTGGNFESPQTLKNISDYWFTQGVNQLVFHTSAHQPLDTKPGNTMVGVHLHRNITWAEHVKPLTTYFARNSFMLQTGQYFADIAYLLNEGAPSTMPFWGGGLQPAPPKGFQFDYINADVLRLMFVNKHGKLEIPSGMTYSILVLPQVDCMTVSMLKKIKELVEAGAVVIGPKPERTPGLAGYPSSDTTLRRLAIELWGDLDGISRTKRNFGKGKIAWGLSLEQLLLDAGVEKDAKLNYDEDQVSWIHRRNGNTDIYFLVNRTNTALELSGRFNVVGKKAELWRPGDGSMRTGSYVSDSSSTLVTIPLTANESVFVVFDDKISNEKPRQPAKRMAETKDLSNGWSVNFRMEAAPATTIQIQRLVSWTENTNEQIKYFSGTATYSKTFAIERAWSKPGARIILDLGAVKDLAEVFVNGNRIDVLWCQPFEADITKAIKGGMNKLEIRVTNQWSNRLVGDREHPARKVLASYPPPFGRRQYELLPSGLLGPVKLRLCSQGCD